MAGDFPMALSEEFRVACDSVRSGVTSVKAQTDRTTLSEVTRLLVAITKLAETPTNVQIMSKITF